MEIVEVEKLLKGVGVIIDDAATNDSNMEYHMVKSIITAGVPMAVFTYIPEVSVIDSLGNISFIILDWEFSREIPEEFDGLEMGDEFKKDQKDTILSFLKVLLERVFVPVFIITGQDFPTVKGELIEAGIYHEQKSNRIMLKQKREIQDYDSLLSSIKSWLEKTPSALALKQWEFNAVKAKNKMFLELYNTSPRWVNVLLKALKSDTKKNVKAVNHGFNNLLNNNFINRMHDGSYYDIGPADCPSIKADEIRSVLQGERYITYDQDDLPDVSYVGDLYRLKTGGEYRLNIRAQCDIIREEDPILYLIPGIEIDASKIVKSHSIKMDSKNNKNTLVIGNKEYSVEELIAYDKTKRSAFNTHINDLNNLFTFNNGEIIEKKYHSVLGCIADKKWIEFRFKEFIISKKSDLDEEAERIGRIIPPYITRVQNAFSNYIVREGQRAIPDELIEVE